MEMEAEAEADDTEEETVVQLYQTPPPPRARLTRQFNAALYCMPAIIALCVEAQSSALDRNAAFSAL